MRIQACLLAIVLCLPIAVTGCNQEKLQQLQTENSALKEQNQKLQEEVAQLKETADYHYQQGIDAFNAQKYDEAKTEFEMVVNKYPQSPLVPKSKEQLAKIGKKLAKIEMQKRAEEQRERLAEERRERLSGTPIDYRTFIAKSGSTGLQIGKRYRFEAGINHDLCLTPPGANEPHCGSKADFDDENNHEEFLKELDQWDKVRTIVASMGDDAEIHIHRIEQP